MATQIEHGDVRQPSSHQIQNTEKPPKPTIAAWKRVNALKLVMDERHTNERVQTIFILSVDVVLVDHQTDDLTAILWRHKNGSTICFVL